MGYSLSHFCVDFCCFYMLFWYFTPEVSAPETVAVGFLLYNVIAFGLQAPIGFFCDERPGTPVAAVGCGLLLAALGVMALPLSMPWPWPALCVSALGNACFHVGGGIDSLRYAEGRMARSGVFVSTGALGVALGTLAGKGAVSLALPLALALLSLLLVLGTAGSGKTDARILCRLDTASTALSLAVVLALALSSVVIRAYAGAVVPMDWRTGGLLLLLPAAGAFAGKFLGGFLADRFGARRTGALALLLSIPFLCLGNRAPALSVTGLLLFNLTMPVSLGAVASRLPHNPGLAFGLTTLALLCGSFPTFFLPLPADWVMLTITGLILLSALCLYCSTKNQSKGGISHEHQEV